MAITGTGTQGDPFIVHSYDEIKSAIEGVSDGLTYIKLDNNIDCNDYGETFEWQTCGVSYSGVNNKNIDFDLNNKTIKNIKVKANNAVFSTYGNSKIHDGEILNVFTPDAYGFAHSYNKDAGIGGPTFKNVSMSISGTGSVGPIFYNCPIDSSAIYIEKATLNNPLFLYSLGLIVKNSDIKVKVDNINTNPIIGKPDLYNVSGFTVDSCRFTGVCKGKRCNGTLINHGTTTSSVVDIDFNQTTDADGGFYAQVYIKGTGSGIFNTDKIADAGTLSDSGLGGLTPVTSAQIVNGDALRAKGFVVVNVG